MGQSWLKFIPIISKVKWVVSFWPDNIDSLKLDLGHKVLKLYVIRCPQIISKVYTNSQKSVNTNEISHTKIT